MTSARYKEYISKYNLRRFVDAHRQIYSSALNEIRSGEKQSHWMWYIFPQFRGLGHSLRISVDSHPGISVITTH